MTTHAPSADDIKAGFVHQTAEPIVGEPTYPTLDRLATQLIRNATTVPSRLGGGQHGLAGLAEAPDVYLLRTGHVFNRPPNPGEQPQYPANATETQRTDTLAQWTADRNEYLMTQRTETLLLNMVERAIEDTYLTGMHDDAHGFGNRSLLDVMRILFQTYGHIGPNELLQNTQALSQPVDPNAPLAVLFKKVEDCQKFASDGGSPFTPQQILQAAENLVLQTGKYGIKYREWMDLPTANRTYAEFKRLFNKEFQLQKNLNVTAQQAGFQHAHNVIPTTDEDSSLASAAQDFAAAEAQRQTALAELTATNGTLNTQLANMALQNQQLQQQMAGMQQQFLFLTAQQQQPPPQQPRNGRSRHRNRNVNHRPPTDPTPPWQPPTNATPGTWPTPAPAPQPPHGWPAPQTTWPPSAPGPNTNHATTPPSYPQPTTPGALHNGPAPTPWTPQPAMPPAQRNPNRKRHNNLNYCWTHGGDIADSHHSWTCQKPLPGHQTMATRQAPMGGNPKNLHKVWMGPTN